MNPSSISGAPYFGIRTTEARLDGKTTLLITLPTLGSDGAQRNGDNITVKVKKDFSVMGGEVTPFGFRNQISLPA